MRLHVCVFVRACVLVCASSVCACVYACERLHAYLGACAYVCPIEMSSLESCRSLEMCICERVTEKSEGGNR